MRYCDHPRLTRNHPSEFPETGTRYPEFHNQTKSKRTSKSFRKRERSLCWWIVSSGSRAQQRTIFSRAVHVVHLQGQWSSDKDDYRGQKSNFETRVKNPQALDKLFGRINFDPKNQIRCVDTKNQLADILTKSSFSKDEWNSVLRSLYIMNLSMFSRNYFSHSVSDPTRNQESLSKRGQEQCLTCLTVRIVGVKRVALLQHWATLKFRWKLWHERLVSNIGKPQRDTSNIVRRSQERTTWKCSELRDLETGKQEKVISSDDSFRKRERTVDTTDTETEYCNMKITYYSYLSKVFTFLQQKLVVQKGCETFGIQASKTNKMMLGMFLSSSMRAAVHLHLNYEENLETYKLMDFEHIQSLFSSRKFWWWRMPKKFWMWKRLTVVLHAGRGLTLAHDQVKHWSKAKVRAHSDSVSCLGKMSSKTESKMVKSGGRISDVLCSGRVPWNRRGCNWIRAIFGSRTLVSISWIRSKRQYPTVPRSLKSFRWMLDCEWMDYLLSTSGKL